MVSGTVTCCGGGSEGGAPNGAGSGSGSGTGAAAGAASISGSGLDCAAWAFIASRSHSWQPPCVSSYSNQ
jgi:hypothetical protein